MSGTSPEAEWDLEQFHQFFQFRPPESDSLSQRLIVEVSKILRSIRNCGRWITRFVQLFEQRLALQPELFESSRDQDCEVWIVPKRHCNALTHHHEVQPRFLHLLYLEGGCITPWHVAFVLVFPRFFAPRRPDRNLSLAQDPSTHMSNRPAHVGRSSFPTPVLCDVTRGGRLSVHLPEGRKHPFRLEAFLHSLGPIEPERFWVPGSFFHRGFRRLPSDHHWSFFSTKRRNSLVGSLGFRFCDRPRAKRTCRKRIRRG